MDKIFLLHHPPLEQRKYSMQKAFDKLNLTYFLVDKFGPDEIADIQNINGKPTFSTKNEYSLFLKHKFCLEFQIENNLERILILEDDALIDSNFDELNFVDFYKKCIQEFIVLNGDIMFLGTCCGIMPNKEHPQKFVYSHPSYQSRCTHCYVTTLNCAKKAIKYINSNLKATDFFWNDIISLENLTSCHTNPAVYQGSEKKVWSSSLRNYY